MDESALSAAQHLHWVPGMDPSPDPVPCFGQLLVLGQFFFFFFLVWTVFNVFIEFITILLLFYVWVFLAQGVWNLSPLTRDGTRPPCAGR